MLNFSNHIGKQVSIAPLIIFRVLFGLIMLVSIVRFWAKGWIYELYIMPEFFFPYYGFEWVKPLGEWGMYGVFALLIISAVGITVGACYRVSIILFFLLFSYVELIDKTNYLNHYYFVSIVSFLMIWLPANRFFSVDSKFKPSISSETVPAWTISILKLQLAIVYFYAGIAKLNYDWMLEALPLRMWLPVHNDLPLIGPLLNEVWVAYFFSWFGAIYDLTIPFFLLKSTTRPYAYIAVIAFHLLTWVLFPIGMFPFIMVFATLIFFSEDFHKKLLVRLGRGFRIRFRINPESTVASAKTFNNAFIKYGLACFIAFQLLFPLRYLAYPGNIFWTEEGYRFSWRVMLMEKAGYVTFHVKDSATGAEGEVYPSDYLTPNQEKMMSTQPDMILQFAHFVEEEYKRKGIKDPEVRAEAYVTLNGKGNRPFINSLVDLTKERENYLPKKWILSNK